MHVYQYGEGSLDNNFIHVVQGFDNHVFRNSKSRGFILKLSSIYPFINFLGGEHA